MRSETGWKQVGKSREDIVREKLDLFYFKIHSLDPDSYYQIELTAHNAIGWSKSSFLVVKTASGKRLVTVLRKHFKHCILIFSSILTKALYFILFNLTSVSC